MQYKDHTNIDNRLLATSFSVITSNSKPATLKRLYSPKLLRLESYLQLVALFWDSFAIEEGVQYVTYSVVWVSNKYQLAFGPRLTLTCDCDTDDHSGNNRGRRPSSY